MYVDCSTGAFGGFEWIFINLLKSAAFSLQSPDITKQPQTSLESI